MATALRKLSGKSDFERSRERWDRVTAARRELIGKLDGAQAALALRENPPGDRETRSPVVQAKAAAYLNGRRPDPDRLRSEIRILQERVADDADEHQAEGAAWRQALEAEQGRLAALCRPRHAQAVRQLARAVEELSAAVEAERLVRSELADVGALHALPDAGFEFGVLSDYHSPVSTWNRRMLGVGLL